MSAGQVQLTLDCWLQTLGTVFTCQWALRTIVACACGATVGFYTGRWQARRDRKRRERNEYEERN